MSADGTPRTTTTTVRLNTLLESPWQPPGRSERNLEGLVGSIRAHGITNRLLVRRRQKTSLITDGGPLEIIEGHRTRAAALLAGVEEAEARVFDNLDDDAARELFYVTNAHRLDMTPLEEAEVFGGMRASGWTPERIAERSGKSLTTVHKRLVLLGLIPKARKALDDGLLLVSVAETLAILPADAQAQAMSRLVEGDEPAGRRVGLQILQIYQRSLADVPWGLADAELLPAAGACTACPKRTKAQLVLLGEDTGSGDRCLDGACFDRKWKAHEEEMAEVAEEESDHRPSKPAKSDRPPPGPVTHVEPPAPPVDLERLATDAAIKRAVAEVTAAAERKKKLDGAMRFLVGLFVRGASAEVIAEVVARRIGPNLGPELSRDALIDAITDEEREAVVFSIGVELAVTADPSMDDGPLALACRHLKVDFDEIRSEELARLKKEAKKSAKDKPTPGERVGYETCGWVDEREDLCSACAPLLDAIEEELSEKPLRRGRRRGDLLRRVEGESSNLVRRVVDEQREPRPEAEVIKAALEAGGNYFDEPHAKKAINAMLPRDRVEKAARAKLTKGEVHLLVKVPTGKRGKPPVRKLCEVDNPAANVEPVNTVGVETCVRCSTAWATIAAARKEAGL
jgi:ParB/RepB/Spo0J family partition protein